MRRNGGKDPLDPFSTIYSKLKHPFDDDFSMLRKDVFGELISRDALEILNSFERRVIRQLNDMINSPSKSENGRESEPLVYGWSLNIVNGKPEFREFGNLELTKHSREPVTDVIVTEKNVSVVAELPGVNKEEVKVEVSPSEVYLETIGPRKYQKTVRLPTSVNPDNVTTTLNNGVLEVKLGKQGTSRKTVKVN